MVKCPAGTKITGWKIDIKSKAGEVVAQASEEGEVIETKKSNYKQI